jgi:AcrR family transcriptional regulator
VDEIAREANISPATLYKHFKSKSHLFHYVMEYGAFVESGEMPSPGLSSARSEMDLIAFLRTEINERVRLKSVEICLRAKAESIDVIHELTEILEELWQLIERHRAQLSMSQINSPLVEFPELSEVFANGLQSIMDQLGEYLSARIRIGMIRPLVSVPGMARTIMETVGFFAWKQDLWNVSPRYRKEEVLTDLVATLGHGLAATTPAGAPGERT